MRFNAHLIQSQGNVGDVGVSPYYGVAGTNWNEASFTSVSEKEPNLSTGDDAKLGKEMQYRNAFINKIFSSKRDLLNNLSYTKFFEPSSFVPLVYPNELPTMGQVTDYLLKPKSDIFQGGIIDRFLGNTKDTVSSTKNNFWFIFDTTRYLSGGSYAPPSESDWNNYNLVERFKFIFDKLFNSNSESFGFKVHAQGFYGGNLKILQAELNSAFIHDFGGGTKDGSPKDDPIFQILGRNVSNQTIPRSIQFLYNNNDDPGGTFKPVGIAGEYNDSGLVESFNDYGPFNTTEKFLDGTTKFSFIDVSRYYLRDQYDRHGQGGQVWLNKNNGLHARFNFKESPSGLLYQTFLEKPGVVVNSDYWPYIVTTRPSSINSTNIYSYRDDPTALNFNFTFRFKASNMPGVTGSGGLAIRGDDGVYNGFSTLFRYDADGRFCIRNGITSAATVWDTIFNWIGVSDYTTYPINGSGLNRPWHKSDHHVLLSDATETIYGKVDLGTDLKFLVFSAPADAAARSYTPTKYSALGSYQENDGSSIHYGVCVYENMIGYAERKCKVPFLSATAGEFVVTRPYLRTQTLYQDTFVINYASGSGASIIFSPKSNVPGIANISSSGALHVTSPVVIDSLSIKTPLTITDSGGTNPKTIKTDPTFFNNLRIVDPIMLDVPHLHSPLRFWKADFGDYVEIHADTSGYILGTSDIQGGSVNYSSYNVTLGPAAGGAWYQMGWETREAYGTGVSATSSTLITITKSGKYLVVGSMTGVFSQISHFDFQVHKGTAFPGAPSDELIFSGTTVRAGLDHLTVGGSRVCDLTAGTTIGACFTWSVPTGGTLTATRSYLTVTFVGK